MDGMTLLVAARAANLTVRREGDQLVVEGPRSAEPIARSVLRHKVDVLHVLANGSSYESAAETEPLEPGPGWIGVREFRRQAEDSEDLYEIWLATVREVSRRWQLAPGPTRPWLSRPVDERLQDEVSNAIRAGNRMRALVKTEEWRSAWLRILRQPDFESTGALNVLDEFRRAQRRYAGFRGRPATSRTSTPVSEPISPTTTRNLP